LLKTGWWRLGYRYWVFKGIARKARPDFRELKGALAKAKFYSYGAGSR